MKIIRIQKPKKGRPWIKRAHEGGTKVYGVSKAQFEREVAYELGVAPQLLMTGFAIYPQSALLLWQL